MLEMIIGKPKAAPDGAAARPAERSKSEGEVSEAKFSDAYFAAVDKPNSAPDGKIPIEVTTSTEAKPEVLAEPSEPLAETGDHDQPAISTEVDEMALSVSAPAVLSEQPRKMVLSGTNETAFGNQVAQVFERVQAGSTADQQESADQSLIQRDNDSTHDALKDTDISVVEKKLHTSNVAGASITSQTLRGGSETSFANVRDMIPQLKTTAAQFGHSIAQSNTVQPRSFPPVEGEAEGLQNIKQPPPQPTLRQTGASVSPSALTTAAANPAKPAIAPILRGEINASLELPGAAPSDVEGFSSLDGISRSVGSSHSVFSRTDTPILIGRQLVEAVHRMPERPVELALNPEELGRVKMSISASDGGITVSLLAERPETLDLMRRHIDQLAREFQALGYASINFAFTAGQENRSAEKGLPGEDQAKDGSERKTERHAHEAERSMPIRLNLSTGLDLRL